MSELVRYSRTGGFFPREFILLQGLGCKWARCTFCDYYLDASSSPFETNRKVLSLVSGEYGVLDVINSGSAMELDDRTVGLIAETVEKKDIHDLWFEAHWIYRDELEDFAGRFPCRVHYRLGVESFNPDLRIRWRKGIGRDVTPADIRRYYDGVCLLAGVEGQSLEDIAESVRIAEEYFDYYSVNLFCPNTTSQRRDDELAGRFVRELVPQIRKSRKAEVLVQNTDLGVG